MSYTVSEVDYYKHMRIYEEDDRVSAGPLSTDPMLEGLEEGTGSEDSTPVYVNKPRIPLVKIAEFYAKKLVLKSCDNDNFSFFLFQDALFDALTKKKDAKE